MAENSGNITNTLDTIPRNKNGVRHGYGEIFYMDGTLMFSGTYDNGTEIGYWIEYDWDGTLMGKEYFII